MKSIFDWLNKLVSNSGEVSSKRFVTIVCVLLIIAMVIANICGKQVDPQILWPVVMLCAATIGLTVTSDVLNNTPKP